MFGDSIPASPSVAVWHIDGKFTYFGPYTSGLHCGEGEDWLEPILAGAVDVRDRSSASGQWTNQESVGCFCAWPDRQAT